jgi:iron complex outermembrane receptor protein
MRKFGLLGSSATRSLVLFGLGVAATAPALAQDAPAGTGADPVTTDEAVACNELPTPTERDQCLRAQARPEGTPEEAGDPATMEPGETSERQAEADAIVVTGSRIRRSPFNSPDPLTIIDPELENKAGEFDTAEILQTSPVAAGSFQITSLLSAGGFVTNGGVGAQTLSLRGLGPERTLVLLNGRRAGPAGTRGAVAGFDLNVIPSEAIQSVEVLKTGASSIYGSDAIAGVVNLLTRKSTDGLVLRGSTTVPVESGGETYSLTAAYGKEFSRGHLIGGVNYYRRNELERQDRTYFGCPEDYIFNTAGDRVDLRDPRTGQPRCIAFTNNLVQITAQNLPGQPGLTYGLVQFNEPGSRFGEFLPTLPSSATFAVPAGFLPANIACPATATLAQFELCRNAQALLNGDHPLVGTSSIQPRLNRYTVWLDGGFEITPNIELVGEFLANRRQSAAEGIRFLGFTQFPGQTLATGNARPVIQCSAARIALNPLCDPTGTGDPLNAGFVGNVLLTPNVAISSNNSTEVDYYRAVGGVKADLGGLLDGWNLNSYVQYSRSDGDYTNERVFLDAVETQEFRSRRCRPGEVTRIRGVPCMDIDFTDPRVLRGEFTPAERAFLFGSETGNTVYTQLTAEASIAGTLIRLPAGPVGAAFGVQWRRDEIDDTPGAIALSQNIWGQSFAGRTAGFQTSKEAFAEVEVPLLRDAPLIQSLTFSGAARVTSTYAERDPDGESDSDKGNWTYKLGLNWHVNDWLAFRASYGTSFRSPALFEQFLANQSGFQTQAAIDPCIRYDERVNTLQLSARIGERCAALGLPPGYLGLHGSATVFTGGGVGVLDPETSTAKNFSVLLTPDVGLWGGMKFSVAVDYFDIEVKGQVTTIGAANIIFSCLDSDDYPQDPTCALFDRDLDPNSGTFGAITNVRNPFININNERNRGVDVTTRVTQDLGRWGSLSALAQMTWQIEDRFELFQGFEADGEGEIGEPGWVGDFKLTWADGPWSLFYGFNVVGAISNEEDLRNARAGDLCFSNPTRVPTGDRLICPVYKFGPQFYHSASITRDIDKRFSMTIGLSNIFGNKPPRPSGVNSPFLGGGIGQIATFGTQYDLVGRRAFVSVRATM